MAATIVGALQPEMRSLITDSRILLVGAGGIGCEVLKNLALMGFGEIEVIDLDTIDVSNLNRQFLFNKGSVGKAKSHVARESVLKFNPNINIKSHVGDITDQKYGSAFFKKFKLVINALDNKMARNHVNRMCLACDIPLIESGTMGYIGQVEFIKKGLSLCYECFPKPEPKSYPMCTIRNTPKEPIHCVTWAKFLFSQLFGESEEDVSMEEQVTTADAPKVKVSAREWAKNNDYDPKKLCKKIFIDDILYLLTMPILFAGKIIKPTVLDESVTNQRSEYAHELDTKILSLAQYITMFLDCVKNIREKFKKSDGCLTWDKDDDDFMHFIVASSNIRSEIFHIPLKSHFDIKSMAGNIIPAIATANAVIGGQIVIHAMRILKGNFKRCQTVYLRELPNHKGEIMAKDKVLQKPNPKCSTCSTDGQLVLCVDLNMFTLQQFEELVLKKKLNMVRPDVTFNSYVIISSDEEDDFDLSKTLHEIGVTDGSQFSAEDFHQNYSMKIMFRHKKKEEEGDPDFIIHGDLEELWNHQNKKKMSEEDEEQEDDDDLIEIKEQDDDDLIEIKEEEDKTDDMDVISALETNDDDNIIALDPEPEVCFEEMLALKRKADDVEDVSELKKSRVDE